MDGQQVFGIAVSRDRGVLYGADEDAGAVQAQDRQAVGFRAAAGEDHFLSARSQRIGHGRSGSFDDAAGLPAGAVDG